MTDDEPGGDGTVLTRVEQRMAEIEQQIDGLKLDLRAYRSLARRTKRQPKSKDWTPQGRTLQWYQWLQEQSAETLPRNRTLAYKAAGLGAGTGPYCCAVLQRNGYLTVFKEPDGRWGFQIKGYEKVVSLEGDHRGGSRVGSPRRAERRFTKTKPLTPELVKGLPGDHPAIVGGITLFPSTVVEAHESPRIFIEGKNSPKLGSHVVKGPWRGMPIFYVNLEERATCPDTCHHWSTCYGNGMPQARRHRHGPGLEVLMQNELRDLQKKFPDGFVVRLHNLGDFYSVEYANLWKTWLDAFPALHVFGYTARRIADPIGLIIHNLAGQRWDRFAVRESTPAGQTRCVTTIDYVPETPRVAEGIVCPAQTGKTECCGTCGLCWSAAAKDDCIAFVLHGNPHIGRPKNEPPKPPKSMVRPRSAPIPMIVQSEESPLPDYEIDMPLKTPVERRCQGCEKLFVSTRIEQYSCPTCIADKSSAAEIREVRLP